MSASMRTQGPALREGLRRGARALCLAALLGACADQDAEPRTAISTLPLTPLEQQVAADFTARVDDYLALQRKLRAQLPALSKKATPQEVDADQRALGKLVSEARAQAVRGEFFTPEMETMVRRIMGVVLSGPDAANIKGSIMDENPGVPNLRINERYPDTVPLSTMPPPVLESLPKLDRKLEYRFIGEQLVLMDADAHLVLDFTGDVLP
jgi:hypothetical protein